MKLAFTIIVHKDPDQVVRLARALTAGGNYCVIHCNARSGPAFQRAIADGLAKAGVTTARFLESEALAWGSGSILRTQLRAIDALLDGPDDWSHMINLSGQCLPTQPLGEISAFLADHRDKNFLEVIDLHRQRPDLAYRYDRYYVDIAGRTRDTLIPRPAPRDFKLHFGAFWVILTREACHHLLRSKEALRIRRYLKYTLFPDELIFQTVLMNSPFRDRIVPDMKRLIKWEGFSPNPMVLTRCNWQELQSPAYLFARKFDPAVDAEIFDLIADRIGADLSSKKSLPHD